MGRICTARCSPRIETWHRAGNQTPCEQIERQGFETMSKQARKFKKQKKREREVKRRKLAQAKMRLEHERRRQYRARYPAFRFDTAHSDSEFVRLVRKAVATINFEDTTIFQPWERKLYRVLKQDGANTLMHELRSLKLDAPEVGRLAAQHFVNNLGQTVLDRIPEDKRGVLLPLNDVLFAPQGWGISVIFRCLLRAKGPGGTVYYSRRKPTLEINGTPKIVAFSKHAIDRTCERLKPRWKSSYAALGDVFAFFDQCMYFEQCDLHGGQLAFTFYDQCDEGFVQYQYVEDVLGVENLDRQAGKPHYRLGYCPAVIDGDFIKGKTLLFPGYASTPEYNAILRSSLPYAEKRQKIEEAKRLDSESLYTSQDFRLIKWFHDNGVPQVVHLHGRVFDDVRYKPVHGRAVASAAETPPVENRSIA
jgi:hypothetical protein